MYIPKTVAKYAIYTAVLTVLAGCGTKVYIGSHPVFPTNSKNATTQKLPYESQLERELRDVPPNNRGKTLPRIPIITITEQ